MPRISRGSGPQFLLLRMPLGNRGSSHPTFALGDLQAGSHSNGIKRATAKGSVSFSVRNTGNGVDSRDAMPESGARYLMVPSVRS